MRLGQRGGLERQLTEESALTLDDSSDSSPQGSAGPAVPREQGLYRAEMWLAGAGGNLLDSLGDPMNLKPKTLITL